MAILKLTLPPNTRVCNGKQLTFTAPCDCTSITGIQIEGENYTLVDLKGKSLNQSDIFIKDALVTVVLDVTYKKAYLQDNIDALNTHKSASDAHSTLFDKKKDKPTIQNRSGAQTLTLSDNTIYNMTNITSLHMTGRSVNCGGFIKFGTISNANLIIEGFAGASGDDILESDVSNQLWEFNVAPSPISGESGYIIWKNWSDT